MTSTLFLTAADAFCDQQSTGQWRVVTGVARIFPVGGALFFPSSSAYRLYHPKLTTFSQSHPPRPLKIWRLTLLGAHLQLTPLNLTPKMSVLALTMVRAPSATLLSTPMPVVSRTHNTGPLLLLVRDCGIIYRLAIRSQTGPRHFWVSDLSATCSKHVGDLVENLVLSSFWAR